MCQLVKKKSLDPNKTSQHKEDHPIMVPTIYKSVFLERDHYPELLKLLKYSLLITPSTANFEQAFSILALLVTKQRNSLNPK